MPNASKIGALRLGAFKTNPEHLRALDRVGVWTRERFGLPEDAAVLVSEVACTRPGCPPLETVVAFWTESDRRHHFKVFKPVEAVGLNDLPPRWLRDALFATGESDLECC
jgi:nitrate reductase delta subunit